MAAISSQPVAQTPVFLCGGLTAGQHKVWWRSGQLARSLIVLKRDQVELFCNGTHSLASFESGVEAVLIASRLQSLENLPSSSFFLLLIYPVLLMKSMIKWATNNLVKELTVSTGSQYQRERKKKGGGFLFLWSNCLVFLKYQLVKGTEMVLRFRNKSSLFHPSTSLSLLPQSLLVSFQFSWSVIVTWRRRAWSFLHSSWRRQRWTFVCGIGRLFLLLAAP